MDQTLSAYLPQDRRRALAEGTRLPDRTVGAALFADISGFVSLTEAVAHALGPRRGAEELSRQIDRVYDALMAVVDQCGGSVVGFAGDAITCWFDAGEWQDGNATDAEGRTRIVPPDAPPHPRDSTTKVSVVAAEPERAGYRGADDMREAVRRAVWCGLVMQEAMAEFANLALAGGNSVTLALKVAVAAGPARRFLAGDPTIQVLDVLAGGTIERMALVGNAAGRGEVVLDPATARLVDEDLALGWRTVEATGDRVAVVTGRADSGRRRAPPPLRSSAPLPHPLSPDDLRPWLLPAVYERLQAGHGEFLTELRSIVALFLHFPRPDFDQDETASSRLDRYLRWVQGVLARYEGTLLQLTIGDKGSYLNVAFGAPIAHEDDPHRGVAAALELVAPPAEVALLPGPSAIQLGLSQGVVRAGAYGAVTRRTYGALGEEVNLAARLMERAEPGHIIVSQKVADATRDRYDFRALGSISLKGVHDPVPVFELLGKRAEPRTAVRLPRGPERSQTQLIGREAERAAVMARLRSLLEGEPAGPVIIEGEAGIGKSRLVAEFLTQAREMGLHTLVGAGDAIERSTPYHVWRPIFSQFFDLEAQAGDTAARRSQLLARLDPDVAQLAPLLQAVLTLDLPDNELTAQMTGQLRADNTAALLSRLFQQAAATTPLLLVFEDAHWMDATSWELLQRVRRDVDALLPLIVTRPLSDPLPDPYRQIASARETLSLRLAPLSPEGIGALVRQRLGVRALPEPILSLILEKADGHPFFSEELAYALRDTGLMLLEESDGERRAVMAPGVDLGALAVPNSVQGIIISRIDHLKASHQLPLKVAGVIGRLFTLAILRDVHPVESDRPYLPAYLLDLERLDLIVLDRPEPELAYLFRHAITQEVAYSMLLFAQRRDLHASVARWYEQHHADDLSPYYALLAHHWRQAEARAKTVEYLEKAGRQALERGTYREARDFFAALLDPETAGEAEADPARHRRRLYWTSGLAQAYRGLGQLVESRRFAEEAVGGLDRPVPTGRLPIALALLGQLAQQAVHRCVPARVTQRTLPESRRAGSLEASRLYSELSAVYYVGNETAANLYAAVRRLNLAERVSPTGDLVEAYGVMAFACMAVRLYRLAEYYYSRALAADRTVREPLALALALTISSLGRLGIGQWPKIRADAGQAVDIYARFGDWQSWGGAVATLASAERYAGDLARSSQLCDELFRVAQRNGNSLHQLWGLGGKAEIAIQQGRLREALEWMDRLSALLVNNAEQIAELSHHSNRARIALMDGDFRRAQEFADRAAGMIARSPVPSAAHAYSGYFGLARVYLALWEAMQAGAAAGLPTPHLRAAAEKACKSLRTYTFLFPIGAPGLQLCSGLRHWLAGKPAPARVAWRRSLSAAQRLGMPYEEGLAWYELGRHAEGATRQEALSQAIEIFTHLGATYELGQAEAAAAE